MPHTLLAVLSLLGLLLSLLMLLWLMRLFAQIDGRFAHFRRFFLIQSIVYAFAAGGLAFALPSWIALARILTPISYAYLIVGTVWVKRAD